MSAADAVSFGFTGPCLRASGVNHDLRKKTPYYHYDEFDFDVPIGEKGDVYDRIFVRIEEMKQSYRIVEQALKILPGGPINIDDKNIMLPDKDRVHSSMEELINHFKLIIEGIKPPAGEIYDAIEAPNGELGFYIISDGSGKPYRIKVPAAVLLPHERSEEAHRRAHGGRHRGDSRRAQHHRGRAGPLSRARRSRSRDEAVAVGNRPSGEGFSHTRGARGGHGAAETLRIR